MGPIPLGALPPSQCCMRDLGAGHPRTGYEFVRRVPHATGLALDQLDTSSADGERQARNHLRRYHGVMPGGAPSSPAPAAHRFAAAGLDRAPPGMTSRPSFAKGRKIPSRGTLDTKALI